MTGFASPMGLGIGPDYKDPTHYVANTGQGRLGLPSREYYLSNDPKMGASRRESRLHPDNSTALRFAWRIDCG